MYISFSATLVVSAMILAVSMEKKEQFTRLQMPQIATCFSGMKQCESSIIPGFTIHFWEDLWRSYEAYCVAVNFSRDWCEEFKAQVIEWWNMAFGNNTSSSLEISDEFERAVDDNIYCLEPNYLKNGHPVITAIFKCHQKNMIDKYEQYLETYDDLFYHLQDQRIRMLEIGVQNGGSLQLWRQYFRHPESVIFGADVNPQVCEMHSLGRGIELFCFDAANSIGIQKFLNYIRNTFGKNHFDIIIDDASHRSANVITTFEKLFRYVTPGGYYIVEDIHTSYWPLYDGGFRVMNTSIEYFKRLVDVVNYFHTTDTTFRMNLTTFEQYCIQRVRSITFLDSMVIIQKLRRKRTAPYLRMHVGAIVTVSNASNKEFFVDQFRENVAGLQIESAPSCN